MNEEYRERILRQIANTLLIKTQYINDPGLLNGKMGIALFLYYYTSQSQNESYSDFAGDLLDELLDSIQMINSINFANGLAGIGWAIDYLIKNRFVSGNPDEVLEDVDTKILAKVDWNARSSPPLNASFFGTGIYFLSRTGDKAWTQEQVMQLSNLLTACGKMLESGSKSISSEFLNSILHFLMQIEKQGRQNDQTRRLIEKIMMLLSPTIEEEKNIDFFIRKSWQDLIYFNTLGNYKVELLNLMAEEKWDVTDNPNINNDLAGLGLALLSNK